MTWPIREMFRASGRHWRTAAMEIAVENRGGRQFLKPKEPDHAPWLCSSFDDNIEYRNRCNHRHPTIDVQDVYLRHMQ